MQRILIVSNMYPGKRSQTYGNFVRNQVEQLREKGLIVDVAAITDPRKGKFHTIKKYSLWFLKIFFILIFKGRKYDLVHAHYIFPSGWLALLFKRLFNTKVFVTSHGGDIDQMPKKGQYIYRQTKNILRKADHVIAVGEQLKKDMVDIFEVDEDKITVLSMGVDRGIFFPQEKKKMKERLLLTKENKQLLFVGNIIESKGILELLTAYRMLKEKMTSIELHIIGAIVDEEFKRVVDEKIISEGILDVHIHKPLSQKDLSVWMSAADVFVLPSHIEGFGLVALEAMSVHTPVVATNVGGLKFLLEDKAGVLVEKKNAASIADAIHYVLNDEAERQNMVHSGEKKAEEHNKELIIKKLLGLYGANNEMD